MNKKYFSGFLLLAFVCSVGCGQKGNLYIPTKEEQQAQQAIEKAKEETSAPVQTENSKEQSEIE